MRTVPIICSTRTESYYAEPSSSIQTKLNISVGFYRTKNYQPLLDIGCSNSNPLILSDLNVKTSAEHLPAQCTAMCNDEFFKVLEGDLTMTTSANYKTAILYIGSKKNKKPSNCTNCIISHSFSTWCKISSLNITKLCLMS